MRLRATAGELGVQGGGGIEGVNHVKHVMTKHVDLTSPDLVRESHSPNTSAQLPRVIRVHPTITKICLESLANTRPTTCSLNLQTFTVPFNPTREASRYKGIKVRPIELNCSRVTSR